MYEDLQVQIGLEFKNTDLFERGFTHKSFLNEADASSGLKDNERLEFLGDAVLELVTTDYLFNNYPKKTEGELTAWRAAVVKGEHLATVANRLDLGKYLKLSRGEEASGGREKDYILANTVEALIGAIYLDLGYEASKHFIDQFVLDNLEALIASGAHRDAKSELQEYSQEHYSITPHYECSSESGPDHDKVFVMAVKIGEKQIAEGKGSSKQKAEQDAAGVAMTLLKSAESDQSQSQ